MTAKDRTERQAAALRANLAKRKAQARAREAAPGPDSAAGAANRGSHTKVPGAPPDGSEGRPANAEP
jgi:hypothetical protein